jgi:polyisoprenoid-binding protein YceI
MQNKTMVLFNLVTLALSPMLAAGAANEWKIDPAHSDAHFSVKHMMISNVQGDFGKIAGVANYDGEHFDKASVEATIPVTEINTRESQRDQHLKSPEFLDVAKFPSMVFKSKKIVVEPTGAFKMTGELTLHGVTKEVVLTGKAPGKPVKDPYGNTRIGTEATTQINRKDFGISWQKELDNGGAVIGDDIAITLDVELVKKEG